MARSGRAVAGATRAYFEVSYRLLTGSSDGLLFLRLTAPHVGAPAHGYTTSDDLAVLTRSLQRDRTESVMDLGSGVGGLALEVHRRTGATVTGIDLSTRAVRVAGSRATAARASRHVTFESGSIRRPPRTGATFAYALDSLMFAHVDADLLLGIRDSLAGQSRLFATTLAAGSEARDPVVAAAAAAGMVVLRSENVTASLIERSLWRRRVAGQLVRRRPRSGRGWLALTLVFLEESLVLRETRSGRLRRWRTVVDLGGPASDA